jgi:hypothetical protein
MSAAMQTVADPGASSRATKTGNLLAPAQIDDVANALLVMARELWVVKDRQRVLEALLAEAGVVVPGAVADHQPDAALAADLATERTRYTQAIMDVLCPDVKA